MAKGQVRGSKETRKPKAEKAPKESGPKYLRSTALGEMAKSAASNLTKKK